MTENVNSMNKAEVEAHLDHLVRTDPDGHQAQVALQRYGDLGGSSRRWDATSGASYDFRRLAGLQQDRTHTAEQATSEPGQTHTPHTDRHVLASEIDAVEQQDTRDLIWNDADEVAHLDEEHRSDA